MVGATDAGCCASPPSSLYVNDNFTASTCSIASSSTSIPDERRGDSSLQSTSMNNHPLACATMPTPTAVKSSMHDYHYRHPSMQDGDDHDATFPTHQIISTAASPSSNLKTTGLEDSDYYYAYYSKRYGVDGSSSSSIATQQRHYENREESEMTMVAAAVVDSIELGMGVVQSLTNENEDENHEMIEYLPRTAALLLSALQDTISKKVQKRRLNIDDTDNGDRNANQDASLFENLLLHLPEASDTIVAHSGKTVKFGASSDVSNNLHPPPMTLKQMEANEREADALLESIIHMDDMYSPGSRSREDCIQGGFAAASPAAGGCGETATFFDDDTHDDDSDDEGSIRGDIARLTRSITHLQRDLESADFSFLDDMYNDEFSSAVSDNLIDHHRNGSGNDKLGRFRRWLSRSSIVEQKLLHTLVGGAHTSMSNSIGWNYADNLVLLVLKLTLLVVMILMLLRISSLFDGASSIDDQGQLADMVEWWLFQR